MIYIATVELGRGIRHVTGFVNRLHLWGFAEDTLACKDVQPRRSDNIAVLCDKLYDNGIGHGARYHKRISRDEAQELVGCGWVKFHGCYNIKGAS